MIFITSLQKRFVAMVVAAALLVGMVAFIQPAQAQTSREQMMEQIQQLLQTVLALQAQLAAIENMDTSTSLEGGFQSKGLAVGDRLQTTDLLRVRNNAGINAGWINNIAAFTGGKVVAGPRYADGYTWWHVQYDNGTSGWSAENWLQRTQSTVSVITPEPNIPTCRITTDKNTYIYGEDIEISWTSSNADYVRFTDFSPKDTLEVPLGRQDNTDEIEVEASVTGRPTIELTAYGDDGRENTCSKTVEIVGPSVDLRVNGRSVNTYTAQPDENVAVQYYPRGEIDSCKLVATYETGEIVYEHDWDRWVDLAEPDNYGRGGYSAVSSYSPYDVYGSLKDVEVSCEVGRGSDVTDRVQVEVADSGERRSYSIEFNGEEMSSGSSASETEVWLACRDVINSIQYGSPAPQSGDQVDCYWGNERIYTIDGWKG